MTPAFRRLLELALAATPGDGCTKPAAEDAFFCAVARSLTRSEYDALVEWSADRSIIETINEALRLCRAKLEA